MKLPCSSTRKTSRSQKRAAVPFGPRSASAEVKDGRSSLRRDFRRQTHFPTGLHEMRSELTFANPSGKLPKRSGRWRFKPRKEMVRQRFGRGIVRSGNKKRIHLRPGTTAEVKERLSKARSRPQETMPFREPIRPSYYAPCERSFCKNHSSFRFHILHTSGKPNSRGRTRGDVVGFLWDEKSFDLDR